LKKQTFKGWVNPKVYPIEKFKYTSPKNTIIISYCPSERHSRCKKRGICDAIQPRCDWDECKLIGIKAVTIRESRVSASERKKRVKQKLNQLFKACKPIKIEVYR